MTGQFIWPADPAQVVKAREDIASLCAATTKGTVTRLMDAIDGVMAGEARAAVLLALASKLGMVAAQSASGRTAAALAPLVLAIQIGWEEAERIGAAAHVHATPPRGRAARH